MTRCPYCDHFNPTDATGCERCGASLPPDQDDAANTPDQATNGPGSLDAEVLAIARKDGKIAAIKRYREATGSGLKEAKEAVEALMALHKVAPSGSGCAGMVLLGAVVAGLVGGLLLN